MDDQLIRDDQKLFRRHQITNEHDIRQWNNMSMSNERVHLQYKCDMNISSTESTNVGRIIDVNNLMECRFHNCRWIRSHMELIEIRNENKQKIWCQFKRYWLRYSFTICSMSIISVRTRRRRKNNVDEKQMHYCFWSIVGIFVKLNISYVGALVWTSIVNIFMEIHLFHHIDNYVWDHRYQCPYVSSR